jgi:hypothetical protein
MWDNLRERIFKNCPFNRSVILPWAVARVGALWTFFAFSVFGLAIGIRRMVYYVYPIGNKWRIAPE